MKVLIFYATYGGGHKSAANSINDYIKEHYPNCETELIDCVEYANKVFNKLSIRAYNDMAKRAPWAWGQVYYRSQKGTIAKISNKANTMMAAKMSRLFKQIKPDIVISTHPFGSQMTAYLKKKGKTNCKLYTIMTDFASHEQWLVGSEHVDKIFISNEKMKNQMIKESNIPAEQIEVTGIPISERFKQEYNKEEIYKDYDLNPDRKTILFFGGGAFGLGKEKTVKILKALSKLDDSIQIIAISGKNQEMNTAFKQVVEETDRKEFIKVLDFSTEIPKLMAISDLVITKPGGLTTSESLASNLPMIIINPIPGQEEENAEFLEDSGVAVWLHNPADAKGFLELIFKDENVLKKMSEATKLIAHKDSTETIVKKIMDA